MENIEQPSEKESKGGGIGPALIISLFLIAGLIALKFIIE